MIEKYASKQGIISIGLLDGILSTEAVKLEEKDCIACQVYLYTKNQFTSDINKDLLVNLLINDHHEEAPKSERQGHEDHKKQTEERKLNGKTENSHKNEGKAKENTAPVQEKPKSEPKKQHQQDPDREFDDFGDFEDEL